MNLNGARFLVVGGSGVLGAEFTRQLRAQGAEVLATATTNDSAAKIPAVAEVRLLLNYQDAQSVETLTDYLRGSTTLDGIINAAGVVAFGPASETGPETTAQLFATNALGPIQLFTALYPMLVQSKLSGKEPVVVNISGVVAEQPMPNLAAYSASKTAIAGFLDAVTREWRREGIRVLNTYPGHTETGLASRAISGVAPQFPPAMSAEHVVSRIIKGIVEDEKTLPSSEF